MIQGTLLILLSAFFHATWNALAKKSNQPKLHLLGIFSVTTLLSLGLVPFFSNSNHLRPQAWIWGGFAGLFEAGYVITLALSLEKSPFGSSYTIMRGGAMLVVWTLSALFLKEPFHINTFLGILIVIFGMYLNTYKKLNSQFSKKSFWPYVCALFISGYHICYGQALSYEIEPITLLAMSFCFSLPFTSLFYGKKVFISLKKEFFLHPYSIIIGGILSTLSFSLFLFGLKNIETGYAFTLRNTSLFFAQILAFLIGEKVGKNQWIGALLIIVGAAVVALKI